MLSLPDNFKNELNKSTNRPSWLVRIQEDILQAEETTQTDWEAGTISGDPGNPDLDTSSQPGDVILTAGTLPPIEQTTWNDWQTLGAGGDFDSKHFKCEIWDSSRSTQYGTRKTVWCGSTTGQFITFDFTSDIIMLDDSSITAVEYWIKIFTDSGNPNINNYAWQSFQQKSGASKQLRTIKVYVKQSQLFGDSTSLAYNTSGGYSDGQLDVTGDQPNSNIGDMYFELTMDGAVYIASGYIQTETMDLGTTPTVDGEWQFDDIQPVGTSITYEAWASDTGSFAGEETSLGTVSDGDPITVRKQYYQVKATLSASDQNYTATLQAIRAVFSTYLTLASDLSLGYEPSVMSISSLSTEVDAFKASTIGQVTVGLALTRRVSSYLNSKYPKSKIVQVKAGFSASGFTEDDFIDYYTGCIDDWSIGANDTVQLTVKDFSKDWKVNVPAKWETTLDDVTWSEMHPVDIILDLLQNYINVRDSLIDVTSFDDVKSDISNWIVSRLITKNPEEAKKLIEELRILMSCVFVPQADGSVKIKRFDVSDQPMASLSDDVIMPGLKWSGNADALINHCAIYYAWDGDGDDAADYAAMGNYDDVTSQSDWQETATKEIHDRWTQSTETSQVDSLGAAIQNRYNDPPAKVTCTLGLRHMALEVGDLVFLSTKRAPSADLSGVSDVKFQIVKRSLDFNSKKVNLTLLRA